MKIQKKEKNGAKLKSMDSHGSTHMHTVYLFIAVIYIYTLVDGVCYKSFIRLD